MNVPAAHWGFVFFLTFYGTILVPIVALVWVRKALLKP